MIAVELVPHSERWRELAHSEGLCLREALGSLVVSVHHIGSTSVPGIMAKPIIDLMPLVRDLDALDRDMPKIARLGYECLGEYGLPGRRYCRRDDPRTGKRAYQLHFYAHSDVEVDRHLAFPAYLRAHPSIARGYQAEKLRAAASHPDNVLKYNEAKSDWIKRVEREALLWWMRSRPP